MKVFISGVIGWQPSNMRALRPGTGRAVCSAIFAATVLFSALLVPAQPLAAQEVVAAKSYARADVDFMRGMIHHHQQAVLMAGWVEERTERTDLRMLAERIAVSQADEIAYMNAWLEDRGEETVPNTAHTDHAAHGQAGHAGHVGQAGHVSQAAGTDHAGMPGMLTPVELEALEKSTGREFEILFLESMIKHHEGALVMVADLFGSPGAAQETVIFQFASDVDSGQRAEIARMSSLLARLR